MQVFFMSAFSNADSAADPLSQNIVRDSSVSISHKAVFQSANGLFDQYFELFLCKCQTWLDTFAGLESIKGSLESNGPFGVAGCLWMLHFGLILFP